MTSLLLVGAGLTLRSFQAVLSQPAGIETDNRLTFRIGLPARAIPTGRPRRGFFGELESRLAAEPLIRVGRRHDAAAADRHATAAAAW